jgi:predicted phage baseplate assembly protein
VVNWRDAEGGADAETTDSMVERAPAQLRHRGRAVTAQDFEDLARAATPEVALVKCVPLRNLAIDPDGKSVRPGTVSVILAPFSRQHRPLPSFELIQRVWSYLSSRQSAAVELVVVGPEYLAVEITAEVILTSAERLSEIDETVQSGLADFLDPVSGGPDGGGWTFGRRPHRSDVFSIIHSVDGVDHVATLEMKITEQRSGAADTGRFLVCPGPVHIRYSLLQE